MDKLYLKTSKFSAEGIFEKGKMIILKGSRAKKEVSPSFPKAQQRLREELIALGILTEDGDCFLFLEDFSSKSPSEASNLITGASSNGLLNWKDEDGKTLKWRLRQDA